MLNVAVSRCEAACRLLAGTGRVLRASVRIRRGPCLLALGVLAGCSLSPEPTVEVAAIDRDRPASDASPQSGADRPTSERAAAVVALVVERERVAASDVHVVTDESVTWPNGALGCAKPGRMYTQSLVSGYRVVVRVGGRQHHYHGRVGGAAFLCLNPDPPSGWIMDR